MVAPDVEGLYLGNRRMACTYATILPDPAAPTAVPRRRFPVPTSP